MAASSRRRANRKKEEQASQRSNSTATQDAEPSSASTFKDSCPSCLNSEKRGQESSCRDTWIRCDSCKIWFHWECVALQGQDHETVDRWSAFNQFVLFLTDLHVRRYCKSCMETDSSKSITFKPPVRKSSRKRIKRDYASIHAGIDLDPDKWTKFMENKVIKKHDFPHLSGCEITVEWLNSNENAFREPIVIQIPEGLGMKMPPKDFQVSDICRILGGGTPVEVIGL
jgi:hypothetical protein